jgi:hypothetical protein
MLTNELFHLILIFEIFEKKMIISVIIGKLYCCCVCIGIGAGIGVLTFLDLLPPPVGLSLRFTQRDSDENNACTSDFLKSPVFR